MKNKIIKLVLTFILLMIILTQWAFFVSSYLKDTDLTPKETKSIVLKVEQNSI